MQNNESHNVKTDSDTLSVLLADAKNEERKDRARAVAMRLETLASHITNRELNSTEAAELLRHEAVRFANESQELH
ncbi:DUF2732 family protein [Yokenella regensburgei]|uniref:DUF2732 family protein n=1 Tax=Yokenella regensburgei TaxID=158877 RepID=UPI003EDA3489